MERYAVTLIADAAGGRPSLVPLQSSALVSTFKDEIVKCASKQNLPVTAETHDLTLRLHSQTGPAIDPEDVLSDVVLHSETVFAIFSRNQTNLSLDLPTRSSSQDTQGSQQLIQGDAINIRVVTPANARQDRGSINTFPLSVDATIEQLHDQVASHLHVPSNFGKATVANECNCTFARNLSDKSGSTSATYVIYDKSHVENISVSIPTKTALVSVLQERFGVDIESRKKLHFFGDESRSDGRYSRLPVIAICSNHRHVPAHAKSSEPPDEANQDWLPILDLHTSEMPIHPTAMSKTVKECGLLELCIDGTLEIFAVTRNTTAVSDQVSIGRDALFRSRVAHWNPPVKQTDRGTAMFLGVLRVTTSLLQEMDEDFAAQDAVLHIFDLMSGSFFPALRTLHLLGQGKTPSALECTALSHSIFYSLERFLPTFIILPSSADATSLQYTSQTISPLPSLRV